MYIGPDLRIYDENNRKVSWKIYEIMRREEISLGKESTTQIIPETKPEQSKSSNQQSAKIPSSAHLSYFPELSYAVLRGGSWEKTITKTVFFIGRSEKS